MRIAVNTRFLLPGKLEGLGWYTHELLRRMVAQHPEDEFLFFFDRPFDPAFVYAQNVRPVVLFPPARHPLLWYAWFEWAVPRALKRYRADVFFSPDSYLSMRTKTPTVLTVHDLIPLQHPEQVPWWARDYYRYFFPRYIRRAEQLVAVSNFTKKTMADLVDIAPEKITVVFNGCREEFRPLSEADKQAVRAAYSAGQEYFFYTGAIHPRKNIPRLIRAFDQFKNTTGAPVKLLLAGRFAWETGEVTTAVQQSGHQNDIVFLGYQSADSLPRLQASALASVNVSLSEGFGLPVLESLYCDTPVLCSNTTALPEVAGNAALLVNPESVADIAAGLEKLYTDTALRTDLVEKGRRQRQQFDWDKAAAAVYQRIKETAGKNG
ncbi:MAG: glycosyltransferase family 4 protein [Lewinellaceae bacterium]|nr:glycosyltransferase family 4 protein [Lewinellaceae bacterium]